MAEEVKSSWSWSYLLLILLGSLMIAISGYLLRPLFERPPDRTLSVSEIQTENLLEMSETIRSEINIDFTLKKSPNTNLQSFYQYNVRITNVGELGVENLRFVINADNEQIKFIKPPTIKTIPSNLLNALIINNKEKNEPYNNEWEVKLLEPNEAVELQYIAYSTTSLEKTTFSIITRAKDWKIRRDKEFNETGSKKTPLLESILIISIASIAIMCLSILVYMQKKITYVELTTKALIGLMPTDLIEAAIKKGSVKKS